MDNLKGLSGFLSWLALQGIHSLSLLWRSRRYRNPEESRLSGRLSFCFARLGKDAIAMSSSFEKERVARWLRNGEILDPRNDDDYDTWDAGMEPIPGDKGWVNKKAPEGLEKS
jgi:hypothetical protein